MRVLVIRPDRDARATARRLAALGHEAIVSPLLRIVADPTVALPTDGVAGILLTSRNAVEALAGRPDLADLRRLPAFAVGAKTAAAARTAGFGDVVSADGDGRGLLALVSARSTPAAGALLWPTGRDRAGDLVGDFAAAGYVVRAVEVYRAEAVEALDPAAATALAEDRIDAVVVHSPRSATLLVERLVGAAVSPASSRIVVHAISAAAGRPLAAAGFRDVRIADRPDEDALIATFGVADRGAAAGDIRSTDMTEKPPAPPEVRDETNPPPTVASVTEGPAPDVFEVTPAETAPQAAPAEGVAAEAPIDGEPATDEAPDVAPAEAEAEPPVAETLAPIAPAAPRAGLGATALVGVGLVAALAGGGLGVAGSRLLAPPSTAPQTESRLAAAEQRLAALTQRLDQVKSVDPAPLEARIAALEAGPKPVPSSDLEARLTALETAAAARAAAADTSLVETLKQSTTLDGAALAAFAEKVDAALAATREAAARKASELDAGVAAASRRLAEDFDRRSAEMAAGLDGLRKRFGGLEGLRGEVDGLIGRLSGLETSDKSAKADRERVVQTLDQTIEATEGRVASLESRLGGVESGAEAARRAQAQAVVAVALADLKSAIDAGRAFRAEFEVVRRVAPKVAGDLAQLDGFAERGVPSVAALRDGLPKVVRAMHEAEEARTAGSGLVDRFKARLAQMVRIRPAGETAGTDLSALVATVEARMAVGDLPAALTAWKALPEGARAASVPWGAALEARVSVDKALAVQTAGVVDTLAQPRP